MTGCVFKWLWLEKNGLNMQYAYYIYNEFLLHPAHVMIVTHANYLYSVATAPSNRPGNRSSNEIQLENRKI